RTRHMLHWQTRRGDAALEDHDRRSSLRREENRCRKRRALSLSRQATCRLPQVRQREIGGDAQVTARESSTLAPIGSPVPPTPPIACPRLVRGKRSLLTGKGEGGGRFQPG